MSGEDIFWLCMIAIGFGVLISIWVVCAMRFILDRKERHQGILLETLNANMQAVVIGQARILSVEIMGLQATGGANRVNLQDIESLLISMAVMQVATINLVADSYAWHGHQINEGHDALIKTLSEAFIKKAEEYEYRKQVSNANRS